MDSHMTNAQVEVITSVQQRRRWSRVEKERIAAASLEPDAEASRGGRDRGPGRGEVHEIGREERSIAGLVTVFVGLLNILLTL
jgi:transposase